MQFDRSLLEEFSTIIEIGVSNLLTFENDNKAGCYLFKQWSNMAYLNFQIYAP